MADLALTCEHGHENVRSFESYARHPYCTQEVWVRDPSDGRKRAVSLCRAEIDEVRAIKGGTVR